MISVSLLFRRASVCRQFAPIVGSPSFRMTMPATANLLQHYSTTIAKSSPKKMTIEQLGETVDLSNQKVLVRVDLNVPLDKDDQVTDDTRLRAILPTVNYLLERKAAVILCSHFGRPKGEIIETGKNGRLTPVVAPLQNLLGESVSVTKLQDCVGPQVEQFVQDELQGGQVCILENTRFHAGETKNDPALSAGLGKLADYYIMDAFGTAHRAHSSTVGVTEHVKYAAAGFLMEKEIDFLQGAIFEHPKLPLVAVVGGAKVSTKIPVIRSLITSTDASSILIGGGMIFTFYKALGYNIGKSLVEEDMIPVAKEIMKLAQEKEVKLILPNDVVVADAFDNNANTAIAQMNLSTGDNGILDDWIGLDIGPETIDNFQILLEAEAATVVWNGPMGVFEMPNFAAGTNAIAHMLAKITREKNVISIVGGGDSVAAINQAGLGDSISHISTGGGASLELLEGKVLPGIAALSNAPA